MWHNMSKEKNKVFTKILEFEIGMYQRRNSNGEKCNVWINIVKI